MRRERHPAEERGDWMCFVGWAWVSEYVVVGEAEREARRRHCRELAGLRAPARKAGFADFAAEFGWQRREGRLRS